MEIGVAFPQMAQGLDRDRVAQWCQKVDQGPFSSISAGERITFHNLDGISLCAAAAALTSRVRVFFNLAVAPWHAPAMLAQQCASIDVISGGRFELAVGVGGRKDDYDALGSQFARRHARVDETVIELKRLWAGGLAPDGQPVGPTPVQAGGPRVLCSGMGPKSLARAAHWADGVSGFALTADASETDRMFRSVEAAWVGAERIERPRLVTGVFVALGPDAEATLQRFASAYLNVFGSEIATMLAGLMPVHSPAALCQTVRQMAEVGCDELILVPASSDPELVEQIAQALSAV
jgi:alkanesulfonate monooxygenase SsuD/methylene tetrahydromethanopterin reductase-like flavin-dependent oxidoreductase (luciferase family)